MLNAENLSKTYRHHQAVRSVSFQVRQNECVALLGPNGAGKSTTLQMLAGLLTPDSGSITMFGRQRAERRFIGYLPQYPSFYAWMTGKEFLHFAGKLSGLPTRELKEKASAMLEFVDLKEAAGKKIGGYSGGMKQRLGLAQALLHEPKLLILDEPVSALDPSGRLKFLDMMKELKKQMAVLFSTHILHDAEQVCDRAVILKAGGVSWEGALQNLKARQQKRFFTLSVTESLTGWLEEQPGVSNVVYEGASQAAFELRDANAGSQLLRSSLDKGLTITRFEQKTESLEEVYLKVVHS